MRSDEPQSANVPLAIITAGWSLFVLVIGIKFRDGGAGVSDGIAAVGIGCYIFIASHLLCGRTLDQIGAIGRLFSAAFAVTHAVLAFGALMFGIWPQGIGYTLLAVGFLIIARGGWPRASACRR